MTRSVLIKRRRRRRQPISNIGFVLALLFHNHTIFRVDALTTTMSASTTNNNNGNNNDNNKNGIVAIVGSANQDLTAYTSILPQRGETVMGRSFTTCSGGKGANQARAAAAFSKPIEEEEEESEQSLDYHTSTTHLICRTGPDVFGRAILDTLQEARVQYDAATTVLPDSSISSGVATIVVDETTGDNSIIVTPGANQFLTPNDVEAALVQLRPSVVATQLEIPLATACAALQVASSSTLDALTILNTAPAPTDPRALDDVWRYVDICIPNETELRTLCGKSGSRRDDVDDDNDNDNDEEEDNENNEVEVQLCQELLRTQPIRKAVVCTLGARGAVVVERKSDNDNPNDDNDDDDKDEFIVTFVDAPADLPARTEPIQDTIGAGDAFCGALCSYLSSSLSSSSSSISLPQAAGMACGFASMSVRNRGATYPTWDEIPASLKLKRATTTTTQQEETV
mmetsp:Transcript_10581/g.23488  ORF Transcript_10581/g.23488 Transcript_10581/m.23488 type:complete len:456 (-) Transcript_10581:123-1490(-)